MTTPKNQVTGTTISQLLDLIPKLRLMPGEDAAQFADLRQALLMDLNPASAYEQSLAEQIVNLTWETDRHRRMRDALLLAEVRDFAIGAFENGGMFPKKLKDANGEVKELGNNLTHSDPDRRKSALEQLAARGISVDELLARAYARNRTTLETHERQIAEAEQRLRRLRADFDRLKASHAREVEEAVMVTDNGH